MFLPSLNNRQKELFRDICIFVAFSDNDYSDSEKKVLSSYCTEMDIPYSEIASSKDIDTAIDEIVKISNDVDKRAIAFEILGMVLADEIYDKAEYECINKYSLKSGIPMARLDLMADLVKKIYSMNDEIRATVFGTDD